MESLIRSHPLAQAAVFLLLAALGLALGGPIGAILLGLVIAALIAAVVVAWARMTLPERLLRIAVIVLLAAVTVVRLAAS